MKKALIVVDMQNDFIDGSLGFEKAKHIIEPIVKKMKFAMANNVDLYFTFDTHDQTYLQTLEGKKLPILHTQKGTYGHQLHEEIEKFLPYAKNVFLKDTFGSLDFANYLSLTPYDEIEFCGLVTNMCVLSNVILAKSALPNAKIIVDATAVASFDEKLHQQTLDILKAIHIDVID